MDRASGSEVIHKRDTHSGLRLSLPAAISVALAIATGLVLRLWMLKNFSQINGDTLIYGDLAKNLLRHGQFAVTEGGGTLHSTLIRLPGYPLFLALCFSIFGMENYMSAAWVQIALELAGCLLLADFVRRIASLHEAQCTLWLAALCPFTAVYTASPLTETPTLFAIALALWALQRFREEHAWSHALLFTLAVTYAALLRPDGALVGVALAPAMIVGWTLKPANLMRVSVACALLAVTPFAIWTYRNWRVFHVVEPLAPRYAVDPGEETDPGWQRWTKTWCLDFVSTYYVYWNMPGNPLDMNQLPGRAFDSPGQYAETAALVKAYEDNGEELTPELDAHFGKLAADRITAHPLRYYVWLPLGRLADMWLRPRVENLPIDLDWWVYSHHYAETRFSWFYACLNAFYILLAMIALCLRPRYWPWMLAYFILRSALLATIEAPEARYTLECFPMLFALGGIGLYSSLYRFTIWVLPSFFRVKASPGSV